MSFQYQKNALFDTVRIVKQGQCRRVSQIKCTRVGNDQLHLS